MILMARCRNALCKKRVKGSLATKMVHTQDHLCDECWNDKEMKKRADEMRREARKKARG